MRSLEPEPERVLAHDGRVRHAGDDEIDGLHPVSDDAAEDEIAGLQLAGLQEEPVGARPAGAAAAQRKHRDDEAVVAEGSGVDRVQLAPETRQEHASLGHADLGAPVDAAPAHGCEGLGAAVGVGPGAAEDTVELPDGNGLVVVVVPPEPRGAGLERAVH